MNDYCIANYAFSATLVRAASEARRMPEGSLARQKVIEHAVRKVKIEYGKFFKKTTSDGRSE